MILTPMDRSNYMRHITRLQNYNGTYVAVTEGTAVLQNGEYSSFHATPGGKEVFFFEKPFLYLPQWAPKNGEVCVIIFHTSYFTMPCNASGDVCACKEKGEL